MIQILLIILGLGILISIFEFLKEHFGIIAVVVFLIATLIIGFLAGAWIGLLGVIIFWVIVLLFLYHSQNKKEIAENNLKTQKSKEAHDNEVALKRELEQNCKWLGYTNDTVWKRKLPNYVNKKYETSFESITNNYADQIERQNITNNDDWFRPFIEYLVKHGGCTPVKMLNEVNCPQLKATHSTPNVELLTARLEEGTKDINEEVKAIFNKVPMENGILYEPTRYLLHREGADAATSNGGHQDSDEIDFDDL